MTSGRGAEHELGTTPILVYVRRHRYMHWHGEESRETRVGAGRSARTHSYVSVLEELTPPWGTQSRPCR